MKQSFKARWQEENILNNLKSGSKDYLVFLAGICLIGLIAILLYYATNPGVWPE